MEPQGVKQPPDHAADREPSSWERRAQELTEELRTARERLRAAERARDEWVVRFYNSRPRALVRRAVHAVLDFAKSLTPVAVRLRYRDLYLRCYHRLFPYGYREFQSADLPIPSRGVQPKDAAAVDSWNRDQSDAPASAEPIQAADGLFIPTHPSYRPKISVVLPVWNQTDFLPRSVRSVLAQTYRNFELIIVDDGSDQDLSSTPAPWADDPRVRVIRRPHEGIAAALNAGFQEASGEFFTWTSADNLMKSGMLSALLGFLLRRPSVDMAYANIELIDGNGGPLRGSEVRVMHQRPHATHELNLPRTAEALGLEADNFVGSCFLYRRSAAGAAGEYDGSLLGAEDYDYWLRLSEIGEVRRIDDDECFYSYRVHGDSLTGRDEDGTIPEKMQLVRERHLERLRCFRRPFQVFLLHEDGCGAPVEWVETLACDLERQGQRVRLVRIGEPGREKLVESFPSVRVGEPAEVASRIRDAEAANSGKVLLVLFVEDPCGALRVLGSGFADRTFSYIPPASDDGSERELPEGGLLRGSTTAPAALPADRRRDASLLIPSRGTSWGEASLALKARGSRYTIPELRASTRPLVVYAGPLDSSILDVDVILSTSERHPDFDFMLVGTDGEALGGNRRLGEPDNLFVLPGKKFEKWHIYMSGAAFLWAPFRAASAPVDAMRDVLLRYLAAGKPVLTTDAVRAAGFEDMPNAVIASADQFPAAVTRALQIAPDWQIADDYRHARGPDAVARRLIRAANARFFGSPKLADGHGDGA